jgi:hypothetical protein
MSPPNKHVVYRKTAVLLVQRGPLQIASSEGTRHYVFIGVRRNSFILRGK